MGFGNIVKQLRVETARTVPYTLDTVDSGNGKNPILYLRFAGEGNAPYTSAVLKIVNERKAAASRLTLSSIEADRDEDIDLFAKDVITGWDHMVEDDGMPAGYSAAKAAEFLTALITKQPDGSSGVDVFDKLRRFAKNPENYRGPIAKADELGKG